MELKPCPFCGGDAIMHRIDRLPDDTTETRITCKVCGARTSWLPPEMAVVSWNQRRVMDADMKRSLADYMWAYKELRILLKRHAKEIKEILDRTDDGESWGINDGGE